MDLAQDVTDDEGNLEAITWKTITVRLGDLKPWAENPKTITKAAAKRLLASWKEYGQVQTIAVSPSLMVLDGHQRLNVLLAAYGADYSVDARQASRELTEDEQKRLVVLLHAGAVGSWDWDALSGWDAPQLMEWGMDAEALAGWKRDVSALGNLLNSEEPADEIEHSSLIEKFGVPPFSVLDARQGYWQKRKDAWLDCGIQSELGRGGGGGTPPHPPSITQNPDGTLNYTGTGGQAKRFDRQRQGLARCYGQDLMKGENDNFGGGNTYHNADKYNDRFDERTRRALGVYAVIGQAALPLDRESGVTGTSIFDPVLCELAYRWFMPSKGAILDPFAGGSVRGIVAALLGYKYTGIDLSENQIKANEKQAEEITPDNRPRWITGDSRNIKELAPGEYDFIFSCPPYADLEIYSDDPADLSTLDYKNFITAYRQIIADCVSMLKPNRFACFVVGDVRDKKGFYRNFPAHTIDAFQDAGMTLYNEAILVTAVGSLPIRVGKQFGGYRKLGKTHQNVLVFFKGDPRTIKEWGLPEFGEVDTSDTGE